MNELVQPISAELRYHMERTEVWQSDCPIGLDRLRLLRIDYVDFEGVDHDDGELVTLDAAAPFVAKAFAKMFERRFPIERVRSVHHYDGDDESSMAANNCSCFCYRPIEGTNITSIHSYGLAVDINPLQNPYIIFNEEKGTARIYPPNGWEFLNRHNRKFGMVEELVELWAECGFFIWGGRWTTPVDYHHFQTPRGMAELLANMTERDGIKFFNHCITHRDKLTTMVYGEKLKPLIELYQSNPSEFFTSFISRLQES